MGRRITEKAERLAFQMDSAARERPEFRHGDVVYFFPSRGVRRDHQFPPSFAMLFI
jgi:hypothetical protein